jgi:hypothetical protein
LAGRARADQRTARSDFQSVAATTGAEQPQLACDIARCDFAAGFESIVKGAQDLGGDIARAGLAGDGDVIAAPRELHVEALLDLDKILVVSTNEASEKAIIVKVDRLNGVNARGGA